MLHRGQADPIAPGLHFFRQFDLDCTSTITDDYRIFIVPSWIYGTGFEPVVVSALGRRSGKIGHDRIVAREIDMTAPEKQFVDARKSEWKDAEVLERLSLLSWMLLMA